MYAHQFIEENPYEPLQEIIRASQKFSCNNIEGLFELVYKGSSCVLFGDDLSNRLPYPDCWIDFSFKGLNKCGCLIQDWTKVDDRYVFNILLFKQNESKKWRMNAFGFRLRKDDRHLCWYTLPMPGIKTSCKKPLPNPDENQLFILTAIDAFLKLMSCKNVATERHDPPPALNKKRQKAGKQPLFTYHTLVLKPVGKKQESIPSHLWNNRIHLMRGHFKTFTDEKPLFGKYTGRFWWQPAVRGQNKDGVVMKDYEVRI